ncbi:MBL fold metallo-hydrolase [Janthinobacterium lividum]|nr:MBL fold metallo-hydrolase [Janthinobacterium lividum]
MTKSTSLYYLRDDLYFEPLLHKWYAWPYLLPPVAAAMNLTARNLRLMKSFVANSKLHISASRTPGLAGGDFVNCSEEQVEEVRALIHELENEYQDYFQLRQAVSELNVLLEQQKGMSMEALYSAVPAPLQGYVELVYDMEHHASFRLIEGLLYQGSLYKREAQSISLGLLGRVTERPFVLSSPRLPDQNHLHVAVEFADRWIDRLFALRDSPASREAIETLFAGQSLSGQLAVDALFTETAPARRHVPVDAGVRVSYLGHAGVMLETPGAAMLVDPVIASRDGVHDDDLISFSELPPFIDYVCITHTHMDHLCLETLLQLRRKIGVVLVPKSTGTLYDPSIKLMLQTLGFTVRDMDEMERVAFSDGAIVALPFLGEHADLNIRSKSAWYFDLLGKKILIGADSASLDKHLYRRIFDAIGKIDMLFIGMECVGAPMSWLYGALFTKPIPRAINESRRFNGSDCASAAEMAAIFTPDHLFVYALGTEPWFKYFMGVDYTLDARQIVESDRLLAFCQAHQIDGERLMAKRVWQLPI